LHNFTFTLQREPYSKEEKKIHLFLYVLFLTVNHRGIQMQINADIQFVFI